MPHCPYSLCFSGYAALAPTLLTPQDLIDLFSGHGNTLTNEKFEEEILKICLRFLYIGIASFVASFCEVGFFMVTAQRQVKRLRVAYFLAVMRQDVSWFDTNDPSTLTTKISSATDQVKTGIDKVGQAVMQVSMFFSGFIMGFVAGWQLTLVILAITPVLGAAGSVMAKSSQRAAKVQEVSYSKAGGIAEETLQCIRTVTMFGVQEQQARKYATKLKEVFAIARKEGFVTAGGCNPARTIMLTSHSRRHDDCPVRGMYVTADCQSSHPLSDALALWFGGKLISDHVTNSNSGQPWTAGNVLSTFFAVLIGAFSLGQVGMWDS